MPDTDDQHLQDLLQRGKDHIDSVVEGTLIHIVLDKSGSMQGIRQATIDGFNQLIADQKKEPGKAFVSLTLFDTTVTQLYSGIPIDRVVAMTDEDFIPGGGTALLDAQGIAVEATEKYLAQLADDKRPGKCIFVTMTDGGENSSHDYTGDKIKQLISQKGEIDGWDFAYTGANQDSFAVAGALGIARGSTINYLSTPTGTADIYQSTSSSLSSYRRKTYGSAEAWKARSDKAFWQPEEEVALDDEGNVTISGPGGRAEKRRQQFLKERGLDEESEGESNGE